VGSVTSDIAIVGVPGNRLCPETASLAKGGKHIVESEYINCLPLSSESIS